MFVTEPGTRGGAGDSHVPWNLFFHLGFFEFSGAFTLLFTEVLESALWSFSLRPEASVLESLKSKLLVCWQNKWGKYWIANWMLHCMINFLKCCKCILIMLVPFKCVLQLNPQSFCIAFPYLQIIWSNRTSSSCQVADTVRIEPVIVCFRLLLCWGGYRRKNAADTYILVSPKAARL